MAMTGQARKSFSLSLLGKVFLLNVLAWLFASHNPLATQPQSPKKILVLYSASVLCELSEMNFGVMPIR